MTEADSVIKNCTAADFEYACPKLWSKLKPSLTVGVRHCGHCNRKVYLCRTDADIKLYTSINYCIAIAEIKTNAESELEARSKIAVVSAGTGVHSQQAVRIIGVMRPVEKDGRSKLPASLEEMDTYDIPEFLRKQSPGAND